MRLKRHGFLAIMIFSLYVLGGISFYTSVEGWSTVDAVYFTAATFTTIGYGDVTPATDTGKIFTVFFSFFGIVMVFYFISLFGKYFYRKVIKKEIHRQKQNITQDIKEGKLTVKKEVKKSGAKKK
jgi:voltage-gated potassium channel